MLQVQGLVVFGEICVRPCHNDTVRSFYTALHRDFGARPAEAASKRSVLLLVMSVILFFAKLLGI